MIVEEFRCKFSEAALSISFFNFEPKSETSRDASLAFFPTLRA